jgi:NTE family protein
MRADGVFAGGGVKGIAFAGALAAAARAGYDEWVDVAGTSAGAITAMALAVGYDAAQMRSALDAFPLSELADYGGPLRLGAIENLALRHGLTRGRELTRFIEQLLAQAPRPARTFGELSVRLRVIGVDLAHQRIVVFPEDVRLYLDEHGQPLEPDEFPIAEAVRISAGFPYFFPPLELRDAHTGKRGVLVDGGVASSYPVFLFDAERPQRPTWGFRLYSGEAPEKPAHESIGGPLWPAEMLIAIVETAVNAFDKLDMEAFGNRTIAIPTGSISTLDFGLSEERTQFLYDSGYRAAQEFFAAGPTPTNRFGATPP